jgi:L-lactate utilization protein LutC
MSDMSTDTTTPATDRELVQIEGKARATTVMHWPELVRMINRLRQAEAERDRLRELTEARDREDAGWVAEFEQVQAERDRLREALKKATDKLERAMVLVGSDPEFAAIGVSEFRAALAKAVGK